jgi:K+-sensing histidine kinase KdpD
VEGAGVIAAVGRAVTRLRVGDEVYYVDGGFGLHQISLIDNSAKYSEHHGRIMVSVKRDANEAVIRVQDKGIGIPADTLPHVFDLFVQGKHSRERSRGGLGGMLSRSTRNHCPEIFYVYT